ncbi:hypothetical protein Gohar_028341 [Gossypium harknessii]|uniref:DUF4283 domain-containing protein n=1 Tax=Gossypium harknessii TaxID=34285 RepID=A0A7J9IBQ8_9ROSI|nr:hypothetical protein [Gossypium harknessii]
MEKELAQLSLNEEEEKILQIQTDPSMQKEGGFQLLGFFLTASIIHFPAMRSSMANLWHPVCGVQIRDLGDKRYLFQFFHIMDMERVLKGLPWTFNNHLLILCKLRRDEDPLKLGNFIGVFMEYDGSKLGKENRNFMRIRVQIDIRKPLKRKKQVMFCGSCSYVKFKYERLSLFCFYCGRLGHNDSFYEAKMMVREETAEMGWDLSLRAPFRRALSMNSIWLREEGE